MKERNRFEGWKEKKKGKIRRRATGREHCSPVALTANLSDFVTFGERRKRKGFENFGVEARVDEW